MRSFILSVALGLATVMAAAGSGDVAQGYEGRSGYGSVGREHSYGHERDFHYRGQHYRFHSYDRDYRGWSSYCWFPTYRCYGYYSPTQSCWYYWSGSYSCYMPYRYITTFAPTAVNVNENVNANANANRNTNTNVVIVGGGAGAVPTLPPGAAAVPVGTAVPLVPAGAVAAAGRLMPPATE